MIFVTISILLLVALMIPSIVCSKSKDSAAVISSAKDTDVEVDDVEDDSEESAESEEED